MTSEAVGGSRIRMDQDLELQVVEPLIEHGYFKYKYEVLAFAAAVAFRSGVAEDIASPGKNDIKLDYFREGHDLVIDLLAIETDPESDKDDIVRLAAIGDAALTGRLRLFERYANAGLREMKRECFESEGSALEGLVRLVERLALKDAPDLDDEIGSLAQTF